MSFKTKQELRHEVQSKLSLTLAENPVCPNHHSPLDYLWHSYSEPGSDSLIWAPRGGGKTTLGAVATLYDLLHKPGCNIRILAGSLSQSMHMWEHLKEFMKIYPTKFEEKKQRATRIVTKENSVASILTQSQRAVRGQHVQKLRCDELELFQPDIWEAAQLVPHSKADCASGVIEAFSTLHKPSGLMAKVMDLYTQSGRKVFRWCLLEILQKCPQDRECEHCPLKEDCNGIAKTRCGGHLSIDDAIAMKFRVSKQTWEAEMLCKRPSVRNCVFPAFDPLIHVKETVLMNKPERWLAIDFGFHNPFVCLWIACDRNIVHVVDEYSASHLPMGHHIQKIKERTPGEIHRIACDPAGKHRNDQTSQSNVSLLRKAGFIVRHSASRILDGVEIIRAALDPAAGNPTLFIHPRCQNLIKAMQSYRYPDEATDELPLKDGVNDHPIDALRYLYINSQKYHAAVSYY